MADFKLGQIWTKDSEARIVVNSGFGIFALLLDEERENANLEFDFPVQRLIDEGWKPEE